MNRLWVRLSLIFSSLILAFALLPLAAFIIFLFTHEPPSATATTATAVVAPLATPAAVPGAAPVTVPLSDNPPPPPLRRDPWKEIPLDLLRSFLFAGILGIVGGIAASRIVAAPITRLADAAQAIGAGDLATRVPPNHSSTELDELTTAFNKMAADLQHAAEMRTSLMADVSHELRTPLTVLEGNLRAALDHVYELDEEQIANLYGQTRHLIRLVNDLRELALAEAAQLPLDLQPLDVVRLVGETAAAFEPLVEEKEVKLETQFASGLQPVDADRVRVRQVLHNLLANALRHTPSGGTITIAARPEAAGVALSVADTGDGIEPEALPHVFDRFYRTDPSRSRETGGSGLGLAIVKALIEAQGGTVEAASPGQGQGSVFTLHLPYAQPRALMAS
ncbi:MAG: ATP-binding protein [Caldilineaceae bacterium]